MEDKKIILSTLWISLMLIYLLGDVMRIFSGDFVPGEIDGEPVSSIVWLGTSVLMVTPILMGVLNMMLSHPWIRWANIIASIFWIGFNLISLSGYSIFDQFLLIISMGVNALTIWYAWKRQKPNP